MANITILEDMAPATGVPNPKGRIKGKRASAPKVRSGCLTCKYRRVKCDESRPDCVRCIKSGVVCDGYAPPKRRPTRASSNKDDNGPDLGIQNPSTALPGDLLERQYFELFRSEFASILCGSFQNASFWTRIIPQVCHHNSAVRHGIVALAAHFKASTFDSPSRNGSVASHCENRTLAFRQLGKCIHNLRQNILDGICDARLQVMASVVIGYFESFQGNWNGTAQQLISARKLLKALRTVEKGALSAHTSIDHELFLATQRLEHMLRTFLALNPVFDFEDGKDETDSEELEGVLLHQPQSLELICESSLKIEIFALKEVRLINRLSMSPKSTSISVSLAFCREQLRKIAEPWFELVRRVIESARIGVNHHSGFPGAELYVKIFGISVALGMEAKATGIDKHLLRFQSIISGARDFLEVYYQRHSKDDMAMKFCSTCIAGLFLTATRCRNNAVRREAIGMLRFRRLREGLLDSFEAAAVAEWVADLEDEARGEEDFVPGERWIKMPSLKWTAMGSFVKAECVQRSDEGVLKYVTANLAL